MLVYCSLWRSCMETVFKDSYYSSLYLCVYVEKKKCSWSICLSSICMVIICFSKKFAKGGVCWVFGCWLHFWWNKPWSRMLDPMPQALPQASYQVLEVLLVRQVCAFSFMRVSLSWIISCALRKILFSKHIFCLKDCFGNYCEDWKKIYFQNISNLLRYDLFLFCELDILLDQIFWSPCHQLYIWKELNLIE